MYPRSYAQYTLLERLATGGMSEVDLARRTVDDAGYVRFLVIKRIKADMLQDDSFVRMFKDEARITSELRHTHIAQVYDFGRVDDEYFLALEYVAGTDLRVVLGRLREQRQRMPVRMVLRIASDVLDALHYAHTRTDAMGRPMDVVHRDVNPRNIMIAVSGEVKLIDFGVARATDRLERTQTDHFKGKIAYMAPEQVTGGELDHRVDIFAMGLTLYEMLTGRGAFVGLDQTQILYRILQGQLPRLEVPREWGAPGRALTELVGRALAREPAGRFATAASMREAVHRTAHAFGGLPTQGELAAWLRELDPDLDARLRAKMERLSGPLSEVPDAPPPDEEPTEPVPAEASGTLTRAGAAGSTGTGTLSAPVVVAAGVGTASVALVAVAVVVVGIIAVVGAAVAWPRMSSPPTDPALVDGRSGEVEAETGRAEVVRPLQITPAPDPVLFGGTRRTSSGTGSSGAAADGTSTVQSAPAARVDRVRGAATAEEADTDAADITPAPPAEPGTPEPEPASDPDADPVPEPAVEALPTGKLQVTAGQKGLVIHIDGQPTEHRTGEQFAWPVGTHTVSAAGLAPVTVEVKPNLFAFVALKPE